MEGHLKNFTNHSGYFRKVMNYGDLTALLKYVLTHHGTLKVLEGLQ